MLYVVMWFKGPFGYQAWERTEVDIEEEEAEDEEGEEEEVEVVPEEEEVSNKLSVLVILALLLFCVMCAEEIQLLAINRLKVKGQHLYTATYKNMTSSDLQLSLIHI